MNSAVLSPTGQRVLVVDDEPDIVALLVYHLARAGYRVGTAVTGIDALAAARHDPPAMIVLDLMLPGLSGFDVLAQLRADQATRNTAVLMLTARKDEPDRIRGLSLGADDYMTKPFSPQELVLRVAAILRRVAAGSPEAGEVLRAGPVQIDKAAHRVRVDDREVELTPTEFRLLLTLTERRGRVQAREHLLETVWDAVSDVRPRTVDMHIQRLRTKLGPVGEMIETVRGFGYRMRAAGGRV